MYIMYEPTLSYKSVNIKLFGSVNCETYMLHSDVAACDPHYMAMVTQYPHAVICLQKLLLLGNGQNLKEYIHSNNLCVVATKVFIGN